jgi:hypothetical protein
VLETTSVSLDHGCIRLKRRFSDVVSSSKDEPHLCSALGVALFKLAPRYGPVTSQESFPVCSLLCPSTESCSLPTDGQSRFHHNICLFNIKIPSVIAHFTTRLTCTRKLTGSDFRITADRTLRLSISVSFSENVGSNP